VKAEPTSNYLKKVESQKVVEDSYTTQELTSMLGLTKNTVFKLLAQGVIQAEKRRSGGWDIPKESLVTFLEEHFLMYDASKIPPEIRQFVPKERGLWLPISEAMKEFNFSYPWFWDLVCRGFIRGRKGLSPARNGSRIYVFRPDVLELLKRQRRIKPFSSRFRRRVKGGLKKGRPRGWFAASQGVAFT